MDQTDKIGFIKRVVRSEEPRGRKRQRPDIFARMFHRCVMAVAWLPHYSPLLVLCFGVLTFAGCFGLGLLIQRLFQWDWPTPWCSVAAVCLGSEILSLVVQLEAMVGVATRSVLIATWIVSVVIGVVGMLLCFPRTALQKPGVAVLLPATSLAILLLIALAPIDEE